MREKKMRKQTPILTIGRTLALVMIAALALAGPVAAGTGTWSTNGPFDTGPGNRNITALAVSPDGSTLYAGNIGGSVFSFDIVPLPVAGLRATPVSGIVPLTVTFNDTSTGSPVAWNWSFGDGNTSALQNPVFTYTIPGDYTVALNASNTEGYNTTVKSQFIHVTPNIGDYTLTLYPGWNFVSTPKTLRAGNDTAAIFKDVNTAGHTIWQYDARLVGWNKMNNSTGVNPLDGIWIYSNRTIDIPLWWYKQEGDSPPLMPPVKQVYKGWNAIGFSDISPLSAKSTLTTINSGWSLVIGYDVSTRGYDVSIIKDGIDSHSDSRVMLPTKGYWLFMNNNATLAAISA
jgi:PKD repeat protein